LDPASIENARLRVLEKSQLYTATITKSSSVLQAQELQEKKQMEILDWIWPESGKAILTPKSSDEVAESCQWFLDPEVYKNWISQGPPVLVGYGKGIFLPSRV
jgi:hypothetical protein